MRPLDSLPRLLLYVLRACYQAVAKAFRRIAWLDYFASYLRQPGRVLAVWPNAGVPLGPDVALFVHYDRRGEVRPHVLHYVTALNAAGLSVLFVTNAEKLTDAAWAALKPVCAGILVRGNIGYDFGAMREGLAHFGLPRANTTRVIIVNDSVYGPFRPLDGILARIDLDQADVWGLTESWQTRYHLQSFFVAVGRRAMENPAWREFWNDVRPVKSKTWVVDQYEVGLTQALLRGGLRCRALWPYPDLVTRVDGYALMEVSEEFPVSREPIIEMRNIHAHRIRYSAVSRRPLNPTSDLWRQLLETEFPFIKRELLRDNPGDVTDISDWRLVIARLYGPIPEMIEQDLQRVMRDRAP